MSKDIEVRRGDGGTNTGALDAFTNMDRFVDRFFADPFSSFLSPGNMLPQTRSEIRETNEAYVLSADVPGIPKEDVEVQVDGNILSIRAEHSANQETDSRSHRSYQSFQQALTLPTTVDPDRIEAHCENGVLEVLMPKRASSKPKRVDVQTGKGSLWSRLTGKKSGSEKQKTVN